MGQLVYNEFIFPILDVCADAELSQLHPNNQLLYGKLLGKLKKNRTWFGLHWDWPETHYKGNIPKDYDTYVFSWHLEPWDHDWLDKFCVEHPNQQIVAIGEFHAIPRHENLKTLQFHCWDLLIPYVLETFGREHKFLDQKKYLISSLCNKPSFTKTFVSAHLLKTYYPRNDLLLSWNINQQRSRCYSMNFLNNMADRPVLDMLVNYYHEHLKDITISIDEFTDCPWNHFDFLHPAFSHSLINCTNETYAQTQKITTIYPGPYFSEKTWKPLLAGSAVLPVGQHRVYDYLNSFGFNTKYPWPQEFDHTIGDLDRIEMVLKTLDWIFNKLDDQHKRDILEINLYNYEHIRSDRFVKVVQEKNQAAVEQFLEDY